MVVGNLPYYITSDILLRLLDQAEVLSRAVLMVQREVADRVAANPGNRGLRTALDDSPALRPHRQALYAAARTPSRRLRTCTPPSFA